MSAEGQYLVGLSSLTASLVVALALATNARATAFEV
jgi:hypothetical protein